MGYSALMGTRKKTRTLELDGRGRLTLPKDLREGVETFAVESVPDGTLKLIPLRHVSLEDAKLIESLKRY